MRLSVKNKSFESPAVVQCARASCPSNLQTPEGPGGSSVSWPFSCQFWRSLTQPPDVSRKSHSCSLVHCSFPLGSEGWQTFAGRSAKPVSNMMLLHLHLSENHNEGLSNGHSQLTAASLLYTELWLHPCAICYPSVTHPLQQQNTQASLSTLSEPAPALHSLALHSGKCCPLPARPYLPL